MSRQLPIETARSTAALRPFYVVCSIPECGAGRVLEAPDEATFAAAVRAFGWRFTNCGVFCPEHRPPP